jgi:hypothetical protein
MGKIERFEDIEAWKEACGLATKVYGKIGTATILLTFFELRVK